MTTQIYDKQITLLNSSIEPLTDDTDSYASLLQKIGNSRFVLIGEASHGTQEFYQKRIQITQELITKKGFMAVAIEGDWPDAYRIHRYLQGAGSKDECARSLDDFKRFPTWMWRNITMPPFLKWLRTYNDQLSSLEQKVGFYGLDLYSLHASMNAVIDYLSRIDPSAAERARKRYGCFDHLKVNPETYGYLTSIGVKEPCLNESIAQLIEMQNMAFDYVRKDGYAASDEYFYALENARLVKNAETYYRTLYEGRVNSWNIRDRHMSETFNTLIEHLEKHYNKSAKIIVWAHNSHIGDARATEMGLQGEVNIGQLIREKYDADVYLIGFSTYEGTVTAASDWDAPAECKRINTGTEGSYEELFHCLKYKNFLLDLHSNSKLERYLNIPHLQRAIGVVYRPETELQSHYFLSRLAYQFDSIIHIDKTTALEPLNPNPEWHR